MATWTRRTHTGDTVPRRTPRHLWLIRHFPNYFPGVCTSQSPKRPLRRGRCAAPPPCSLTLSCSPRPHPKKTPPCEVGIWTLAADSDGGNSTQDGCVQTNGGRIYTPRVGGVMCNGAPPTAHGRAMVGRRRRGGMVVGWRGSAQVCGAAQRRCVARPSAGVWRGSAQVGESSEELGMDTLAVERRSERLEVRLKLLEKPTHLVVVPNRQ